MNEEKKQPKNLPDLRLVEADPDPFNKIETPVLGVNPEEDAERDVAAFIQRFRNDLEKVLVAD